MCLCRNHARNCQWGQPRVFVVYNAKVHNIIQTHSVSQACAAALLAFAMSLTDAIIRGDAAAVRALLIDYINDRTSTSATRDARVPNVSKEGFAAAVREAAKQGHLDVIQTLCELLPPPHPPLPFDIAADNTVCDYAVLGGHVALVRYLCDLPPAFGFDPSASGIFCAVENRDEDMVRLLCDLPLERGVDPAEWDNQALRSAAASGDIGIVRLLCELPPERGVDPTAMHNQPLNCAAQGGHIDVVRYLCELPPERGVDSVGHLNWPVAAAAENGHLDVVRYMCELPVDRGVDVSDCDILIRALPHKEVVKYLCGLPLSRGVNPGNGGFVLLVAAEAGHLETVRFLCQLPRNRGVDPAADECMAVLHAADSGHDEIVAFLCRLGPADGFPCYAKRALLEHAVREEATSVFRSVCSLPASVGVSCTDLRNLLLDFDDLWPEPGTPGAECRALCWQALCWRTRSPLLALRALRQCGRARVGIGVAQPVFLTHTPCGTLTRTPS